jgi:hypothetical protein
VREHQPPFAVAYGKKVCPLCRLKEALVLRDDQRRPGDFPLYKDHNLLTIPFGYEMTDGFSL